jgi:hypothetical protein
LKDKKQSDEKNKSNPPGDLFICCRPVDDID